MAAVHRIINTRQGRYQLMPFAIALFCLALIAALWVATTERINSEREEAIANAMRENSNLVMAFEEQSVRTLRAAEQVLRFVRHEYATHGASVNLAKYLHDGLIREQIFTIISVVNERGDIVLSSSPTAQANYADREFFVYQRQRRDDVLFINVPVFGRVSATWQVPMSVRIDKPDGTFGGVVVLSVDPAYFTAFYQKADLGKEGVVALVGLDGIVRARNVGPRNSYGGNIGATGVFAQQAQEPVGNYIGADERDGIRRIYSYRRLEDYPLMALVGTAETEVLAASDQRARVYHAAALLATALIAAFALFLTTALLRQRRTEERLAHQAHYDALTLLANRTLCFDRLERALLYAQRRNRTVGFLFIDLDGFKAINDSLGHAHGDALLQKVAARIGKCVRAEDTVARLGGDEFAIVLPEINKAGDSAVVARKVVKALTEPFELDEHRVRITASVGIATYPEDGRDADTLVQRADSAMFQAKKAGKSGYRFCNAKIGEGGEYVQLS